MYNIFDYMIRYSFISPTVGTFHSRRRCCVQDSLLCSDARGEEPSRDETAAFLSAVAGRRTADRRRDPAEFLLDAARLRVCLSAAARLLQGAAPQGERRPLRRRRVCVPRREIKQRVFQAWRRSTCSR